MLVGGLVMVLVVEVALFQSSGFEPKRVIFDQAKCNSKSPVSRAVSEDDQYSSVQRYVSYGTSDEGRS